MWHVSVTVPAGLPFATLSQHVVDSPSLNKLLVELAMTTYTVVHDDGGRGSFGFDGLALAMRHEVGHVLHAVYAFEHIVRQDVVVRHVAVVARGVTPMRRMAPCGVIGRHDVTVDTCRRVVSSYIGMHSEQIHEQKH